MIFVRQGPELSEIWDKLGKEKKSFNKKSWIKSVFVEKVYFFLSKKTEVLCDYSLCY